MSTIPERILLTNEQRRRLELLADQSGKLWDEVLDEALALYVPANGPANGCNASFYDVAHRSGLIGCLTDAPSDLSANPRHMEGFGKSGA